MTKRIQRACDKVPFAEPLSFFRQLEASDFAPLFTRTGNQEKVLPYLFFPGKSEKNGIPDFWEVTMAKSHSHVFRDRRLCYIQINHCVVC